MLGPGPQRGNSQSPPGQEEKLLLLLLISRVQAKAVNVNELTEVTENSPPTLLDPLETYYSGNLLFWLRGDLFLWLDYPFSISSLGQDSWARRSEPFCGS